MRIRITYDSEILGRGVRIVDSSNLTSIRNIPSRQMAEATAIDGRTRKLGMWTVEVAGDERDNQD